MVLSRGKRDDSKADYVSSLTPNLFRIAAPTSAAEGEHSCSLRESIVTRHDRQTRQRHHRLMREERAAREQSSSMRVKECDGDGSDKKKNTAVSAYTENTYVDFFVEILYLSILFLCGRVQG